MGRIRTHCELQYTVTDRTTFYFAVLPSSGPRQRVVEGVLTLSPQQPFERMLLPAYGADVVRVSVEPGRFTLRNDSTVEIDAYVPEFAPLTEVPFGEVPAGVVEYLYPSRYCESDLLTRFAMKMFGDLQPGFERIRGICNWIYEHLEYVPGTTDGSSTAVDVYVGGAGVCRDYAHLGITLCRALGVPARYVSGYAVKLEPPDFHGFFEAYLDHDWYLFDATRMASVDSLVRIAVGRDAADVAFANSVGFATLESKVVSAVVVDVGGPDEPTTAAISTA